MLQYARNWIIFSKFGEILFLRELGLIEDAMELYQLVENCEYGDLTSEMMCDRPVSGIRDKTLSERLQLDADLTLEKAKKKGPALGSFA